MDELNKQQEEEVVTESTQEEAEQTQQTQEEAITFSQEEVDRLIQAESDRKVSKALETTKAKWEEEFKSKLESEKTEAEKLAKMTEGERLQAEFKKQKEEFENERKSFLKEKLENQTIKELSNQSLPITFANFVGGESAERIHENITTLKTEWDKAFNEALEKAVEEKLKGKTPSSSNKQPGLIAKQDFAKLPYKEREQMLKNNPNILKELGLK